MMIKEDNVQIENKRFIANISAQIEKEIASVSDQLVQIDEVRALVRVLQISIIQNIGVLTYLNQLVSLDTLILNQHLRLNVSIDPIFAGVQKIIAKNRAELIERGFREYQALMLWDNGNGERLYLRLSFFKCVRDAIIREIQKDKATLKFIESNNELFQ